eukprot:101539-Amphidinium_carterae.1
MVSSAHRGQEFACTYTSLSASMGSLSRPTMCVVVPRCTCLAIPSSARPTQRETRSLAFLVFGAYHPGRVPHRGG